MRMIPMITAMLFALSLTACSESEKTPDTSETASSAAAVSSEEETADSSGMRSIKTLKQLYPEFFEDDAPPFKGVEVYVWQMAEDDYRCGLMSGTNREKTPEEIADLGDRPLSVEETKCLLDAIGADKGSYFIIPCQMPYSSYMYEIDDAYRDKLNELFDGASVSVSIDAQSE